jgi:hypothetical protein
MNRRKLHFYVSVFGVSAAALAVACGSFSPYPQEDPLSTYPAGFQHPGSGASGGGSGGDGGVPCSTTEAGTVCPEGGGLPDAAPPVCPGCTEVAAALNPQSIALDKTNIYWTNGAGDPWLMLAPGAPGGDSIMQAGRGGSPSPASVLVPGLSGPFIIKDQGSWLAWSNFAGVGAGQNSIDSFMVGATGPANTPGPSLSNAHGVALDATNVYWVSRGAAGNAVIASSPLAGGVVSTLGMTTAGVNFVPYGVAVDGATLYFVGSEAVGTAGLFTIPITGGVPNEIWMAPGAPTKPIDVAVKGANVYWIDNGSGTAPNGSVYSMPVTGGTVTTMASGLMNPLTLAVDSMNIYFTASDGIHEEPIGSTSATLLAPINNSVGVAADDTDGFVYFTYATAILAHAK